MSEIFVRLQPYIKGKLMTVCAKSGIYIKKKYFDKASGVKQLSMKYRQDPEIEYHRNQAKKISELALYIEKRYNNSDKASMSLHWLSDVVDDYYHPPKTEPIVKEERTFYSLTEEYLSKKDFSYYHSTNFRVMVRAVFRYEEFVRRTQKHRSKFKFDVDKVTRDDMEDFRDYLLNEKNLFDTYPAVFKELLESYPANLISNRNKIEGRGNNATIKLMKKLKAFFVWLYDNKKTLNRPFDGFKIGSEKAGEPIYITIEERKAIASTPMPTKHLETQRDIFVFHCLIGCRVSDLIKLNKNNISGRMLSYIPHKTKNEGEQAMSARVPLVDSAMALIEKYEGVDKQGRLFPFISPQRYNDAIKEIFTIAGLTYTVKVFNAQTEEFDYLPINKVASSHMARKTFIGNLYRKVQDPNLIGQMSGHVDGSRAFRRYRKIEDETLINTVGLLE